MRNAILILACLLLLPLGAISQHKRTTKAKPKRDPDLEAGMVKISPCGVPIPRFDDFVEELKVEWRVATASKDGGMYFYNTHRTTCASGGILSAWIKGTYDDEGKSIASMTRYEFKCRIDQLRITSQTEYYKDGRVKASETYKNAEWEEAIPDSVGERILETICRKKV